MIMALTKLISYHEGCIDYSKNSILKALAQGDKKIRDELVAIVKQEHPYTKRAVKRATEIAAADEWDQSPGFAPIFANLENQIAAIELLGTRLKSDDVVFDILLKAALFKYSHVDNVADAASKLLVDQKGKRRQQLIKYTKDAHNFNHDRIKAYQILARDLTTDSKIYDLICSLAQDTSLLELHDRGEESPSVQSAINHEKESRKYSWHSPKHPYEILVEEQHNFRCGIFKVMDDWMQTFQSREELSSFAVLNTEKLTRELSNLMFENRPEAVVTFCRYTELPLSIEELERAYHTLKRIPSPEDIGREYFHRRITELDYQVRDQ